MNELTTDLSKKLNYICAIQKSFECAITTSESHCAVLLDKLSALPFR